MMTGMRVQTASNPMYRLSAVLDSSIRGARTDIGALATKDIRNAAVMIWNYHDIDAKGKVETVQITIKGITANKAKLTQYRIDNEHSNSYQVWKKMGSPQNPTADQINGLEKSGRLYPSGKPVSVSVNQNAISINIDVPRQGVVLLKLDW